MTTAPLEFRSAAWWSERSATGLVRAAARSTSVLENELSPELQSLLLDLARTQPLSCRRLQRAMLDSCISSERLAQLATTEPRQSDQMWYRAGADLVVAVHLLFIGFVVGGVFVGWRWPSVIWAHIPAVVYGAVIEFAGFACPLTWLENDLSQRAGEAGYSGGFISHYLVRVVYPPGLTHGMQIGLGVLLLLVAIIGYLGFLRRHGLGFGRALTDRAMPDTQSQS